MNTKVTFGIFRIPTGSSPGPHSRLRKETQYKVSTAGYKLTLWDATKLQRREVIAGNLQEKKFSGRRLGLMRAAGPWMTEKSAVLSMKLDTYEALSHEASSMPVTYEKILVCFQLFIVNGKDLCKVQFVHYSWIKKTTVWFLFYFPTLMLFNLNVLPLYRQ